MVKCTKSVLGAVSKWNSETLGFLVNFRLKELYGISVADIAAFLTSGNVYSKSPSNCTIKHTAQSDCIEINLPVLDGNVHNKDKANMANHDGTMEYVNDYTVTCIHILQQLLFILVLYIPSS